MGCNITIRVGGEAGQGMNVISNLLGKVFVRNGLWVFIYQDVMSRIRGGHNFSEIRISDKPVSSLSAGIDILVCMDKNTLDLYKDSISGIIIYDSGSTKDKPDNAGRFIPLPMEEIARNTGKSSRMINTVASGAVLALMGLSLDTLISLLGEMFSRKGNDVVEANVNCARAGYDYIKQNHKADALCKKIAEANGIKKMLVNGCEAIALGAIASNMRFYSAYPMSPSTAILEYLSSRQEKLGLVVEQAEDEIAAINMALGASFSGVRAMTGTSGGGLALMVEGISLSGMTETPIVIVDGQRPAPATGLPTRTEQGDLLFAAHAGHGDFPRAILAPATAEEAFYLTAKAFYLAEKYQLPVFILADQFLNDSSWTVEKLELKDITTDSQSMLSREELKNISPYQYLRYKLTDSGVSPRIIPGTPSQVLYVDSDEHTEEGHITESADMRGKMVNKRLKKFSGLNKEMSLPVIYPDKNAEFYIVSWGTTFGVVAEAVNTLREQGINVGYVHFSEVFPLRKEMFPADILKNAVLIGVEHNATGHFAKLLRMETGIDITRKILKYDGRPFTIQELTEKIRGIVGGKNK